MDITYTYNITKLYTTNNTLSDIVTLVDWELVGSVGNISHKLSGSTKLQEPNVSNFVAFDLLSKDEVVSWIKAVDIDAELFKEHIAIILQKEVERQSFVLKDYIPWESDTAALNGGE